MDLERRSLRIGTVVVVCAILLRLLGSGFVDKLVQVFGSPEITSFLLYMETGRVVRPMEAAMSTQPPETEATTPPEVQPLQTDPPAETAGPAPVIEQAVFSAADAALVKVRNYCDYGLELEKWVTQALDWDLTAPEPTVLILHSHTSESYTNTENYTEAGKYRTLDEKYNMISVGDRITEILEEGGVSVIHDRTLHDYPSYNGSYSHARASVASYLEAYPSIRLVLDIHRDAMEDSSGNQYATTVTVNGQTAAQLMLVVGTDAGGQNHPAWRENMALAVKLHAQLEKLQEGICRPISFRSSRFNQDQSPGAVLVEVGAAGNTRQEALLAAEVLAQAVLALAGGASAG